MMAPAAPPSRRAFSPIRPASVARAGFRSKPAPQGICVVNSAGKVLDWVLMFDDDKSVLAFLDHVSKRFAKYPDAKRPVPERLRAARNLVWARRCEAGENLDMTCLRVGPAYVLHMPGELLIEYQLAAQKMRPKSAVMMAAYGDYGMGYIGTGIAYTQGGYETGPVSRVAPEVEGVLMKAMRELLK